MPNRLAAEQSPYLLQHADNPVDWYPWGEEAFDRARRENKPIFLSIGYSTCHWCHVMEHESFENAGDRRRAQPRLRLDQGRSRGAAGRRSRLHDVRAGDDRVRRLADERVADADAEAVLRRHLLPADVAMGTAGLRRDPRGDRARLARGARRRSSSRRRRSSSGCRACARLASRGAVSRRRRARARRCEQFAHGVRSRDAAASATRRISAAERAAVPAARTRADRRRPTPRDMALATLRAMALGGMRDHVGGGFHRYSVDADWRVPHFEKMLYDQAQLVLAYLEAAQVTGDPFYAEVAEDTLDYVLRELTDARRRLLFGRGCRQRAAGTRARARRRTRWRARSTSGRDDEIRRRRSATTPTSSAARFGIEPDGNAPYDPQGEFTGKNLLYTAPIARRRRVDDGPTPSTESWTALRRARPLFEARRGSRPRPHLDDKVLTAWNGLMIAAFARAAAHARRRRRGRYLADAQTRPRVSSASTCGTPSSQTLLRRYRDGEAAIDGYAEDYAYLIFGLLELFQADGDPDVAGVGDRRCSGGRTSCSGIAVDGGWFSTTGKDPIVLLRLKEDYDGAEPAASSVAAS